MPDRKEVYEVLDQERDHQDQKWGLDHRHSITEYLAFIRQYVDESMYALTHACNEYTKNKALENVRKITALGVVCMEQNGVRRRF